MSDARIGALNRRRTEAELVDLLREALEAMKEEANNNDGDEGVLDITCPYCWGASPSPCSLGCRIGGAIYQYEKAQKAVGHG